MLSTFKRATPEALSSLEEEKRLRRTDELFLLLNMGSQFDHLIRQQIERMGVWCLVGDPATVTAADVRAIGAKGIIVSGGPASVHAEPPPFDTAIFDLGIPVLGICLGFQQWAHHIGATVETARHGDFSTYPARVHSQRCLLKDCGETMNVLMTHGDAVMPDSRIEVLASTAGCLVAAGRHKHLYGVQFHPEVTETTHGERIFETFCFDICGATDRFPATDVAQEKIKNLREAIGNKRVGVALSGGSDSATVAYLLKAAMAKHPDNLFAWYIGGLDRPDDLDYVRKFFGDQSWISLHIIDARELFLNALRGITGMHDKRVAMRGIYKSILEGSGAQHKVDFFAQGTLYTDLSESGLGYQSGARKARIKLHHNTDLKLNRPELTPLDDCVKDNGRNIGRSIGVPEELLTRHPFPGPGLAVRIEGEVTYPKLVMAHEADRIWISELRRANLYDLVWQAGANVLESFATTSKGDDAGEGRRIELWAVWSTKGFTARAALLPHDFITGAVKRIQNEIPGVGRVVYNYSDKPPATIEMG